MDTPYKITKQIVHEVTCLHQNGGKPNLRKVKNTAINKLTRAQYDNMSMTIDDILKHDAKFASTIIGYKFYQSSRLSLVFDIGIYATYQMVKEDM